MFFFRYRRRNYIDSPKDLLIIVIAMVVYMAAEYFLPKIVPDMSQKTVKRVSFIVAALVIVFFTFII